MDRRIDDVRPQQGLEWDEVIFYDADHTERNMFASSDGEWVRREVFEQQASTIAALKEQLAAARPNVNSIQKWEVRYDVASYECKSCHSGESLAVAQAKDEEIADLRAELLRLAAIASQPALDTAPPLVASTEPAAWLYETPMPDGSTFTGASAERLTIGVGTSPDTTERPLFIRSAPPVQQPDDVRDPLAEFTAYVVKNYPADTIIGDPAWHAPRLFRAAQQALATTRPSAALTDSDIEAIGREWAKEPSHFEFERNDFISAVRAILAASGGALAVPEGDK